MIWELYAGTEGQGTTIIQGTEWLEHRGSVGKPVEACEMKVVGENGENLPPGEVGEIFMRPLEGPGTTYRYIGAEAKSLEGGWESLGDMGYMDEDGYLYLTDRLSDMIMKISPASPGGGRLPSSSTTIISQASTGLPTEPRCSSHSVP